MTLILQPDRIYLTDGAATVFDTNYRNLHWLDFKTGSFTLPARTATTTPFGGAIPVNIDQEYNASLHNSTALAGGGCGSVNSAATIVQGMVRVTGYAGSEGQANTLWRSMAGGSINDVTISIVAGASCVTFRVLAGQLYIRENVTLQMIYNPSVSQSLTIASRTIEYRLYFGAFDQ